MSSSILPTPSERRSRAAPEATLARAVKEIRALEDAMSAHVRAAADVLEALRTTGAYRQAGYVRFEHLRVRLCSEAPAIDTLLRADRRDDAAEAPPDEPARRSGDCVEALAQIADARVRLAAIDAKLSRDAAKALARLRAVETSDTFREAAYGSLEEFCACALAPMPCLSTVVAAVSQGHLALPEPPPRRSRQPRARTSTELSVPAMEAAEAPPSLSLEVPSPFDDPAPREVSSPLDETSLPESAPIPRLSSKRSSLRRVCASALLALVAMGVGAWFGRVPQHAAAASATASASAKRDAHGPARAPSAAASATAPAVDAIGGTRRAPTASATGADGPLGRAATTVRAAEARVGLRELARPVAHKD